MRQQVESVRNTGQACDNIATKTKSADRRRLTRYQSAISH